ncbi:helix-turn-helix domain-containing protein, partial [Cryobacterium fucosi]
MSITQEHPQSRLSFDKSDRLAKALKIAGISSNDMAEHLHVSRNTISNYINGRTEPKYSQLRDWALFTGVPLEWILDGVETAGNPDGPANQSKVRTMD